MIWESIEIGVAMQDENDESESPLIKMKKIQREVEKNVYLKKRTRRSQLRDAHRRYTMKQLWMEEMECVGKHRSNSVIFRMGEFEQY